MLVGAHDNQPGPNLVRAVLDNGRDATALWDPVQLAGVNPVPFEVPQNPSIGRHRRRLGSDRQDRDPALALKKRHRIPQGARGCTLAIPCHQNVFG